MAEDIECGRDFYDLQGHGVGILWIQLSEFVLFKRDVYFCLCARTG